MSYPYIREADLLKANKLLRDLIVKLKACKCGGMYISFNIDVIIDSDSIITGWAYIQCGRCGKGPDIVQSDILEVKFKQGE